MFPRDMVYLRNITVDTLHKGDTEDDDDDNNNNNNNNKPVILTGKNKGDWNHFKIIQTIPGQHTRKARI